MILTGKSKLYFYNYLYKTDKENLIDDFASIDETIQNALIIEWFDSVGIYINTGGVMIDCVLSFSFDIQENNTLNGIDSYGFNSRQQATEQAIIKANQIYNEK